MLSYNLENRANISQYEYIYKCIKQDIIDGKIIANEKLPSKRNLAVNLGVSVITVQNAYEQLLYEGYIYAIEKKGYYASDIGDSLLESNQNNNIPYVRMEMAPSEAQDKIDKNTVKKELVIDFTANHDTGQLFPFSTWAKLTRKALLDTEKKVICKPDNMGVVELREAIARYLWESRGLAVNADNIIIGAGTEYLYSLIVQLVGRNRMIAVEDPGHIKVHRIYERNGVKVLHVPIDAEGMIPNILERGNISAVHLSPTHHYPTGVITSAVRRHKILELARLNEFYVIEDDYDSEFHFEGRPIPAMASIGPDKVIYMNTFSKTLMESLRIAYMVLPEQLMKIYREKMSFYSCTVSGLEQYTLAAFIKGGYFERHINRTRLHYKKCRNTFIECFERSELSKICDIEESGAGLHFIIKYNGNRPENECIEALENKGIKIKNVSSYCYRPDDERLNSYLINYFEAESSQIDEAFRLMYQVFR